MATGRTLLKYGRFYVDGYDLSGYTRSLGPLSCEFAEGQDNPINSELVGAWLGQATINPGTFNGIADNTATVGLHALMGTAGGARDVIWAQGIRAEPAIGDLAFMGQFRQDSYQLTPGETPVAATIKFSPTSPNTGVIIPNPWGMFLHINTASTTANTGNGTQEHHSSTTAGGYMAYQILTAVGSGKIQATVKVQDGAAAGTTTNDIVSTGVLDLGSGGVFSGPVHGIVTTASNATINKFLRWQVVFGTGGDACTSITFVLAFARHFV
jgi:hypothetical protein